MKKTVLFLIFIFLCGLCAFADSEENFVFEKSGEIEVLKGDIIEARKKIIDYLLSDVRLTEKSKINLPKSSAIRISYTVTDEYYDTDNDKYSLTIRFNVSILNKKFTQYIKSQEFIIENGVLLSYEGNRKYIKVPDNVTEIADNVFSNCEVEKVILPANLKKIGNSAFKNCKKLKDISVTKSKDDCKNYIPDSVMELGANCFDGCESLTQINIPKDLKKIPEFCFANCKLFEITIPDKVEEIEENAFNNNYYLSEIKIGSKVKIIKNSAFTRVLQ